MTTELFARARAGDGEAFRQLVEPHRHELQVHRYRVLGSLTDAEDLLQEHPSQERSFSAAVSFV